MKKSLLFVIVALLVCSAAAQDPRGRVLGLITDSSGSVVPNASVSATHLDMNTRTPTASNEAGNYDMQFLLPGVYRIVVEAQGFKRYTREPIEVRVGDTITLNITLEVGAVTETITVTGEAPLLESATANIGQVIDRRQLDDLPIGGGNVLYLAQMSAGVTTTQTPGHNWLPSAVDSMSNIMVAGTRSGSSEFTLDGISNMTRTNNSFAPPADMVQEFRMQAVSYDASQGHAAGGTVSMSLKAGTNALHGSLKWDVAPNPWQANSFFTNKQIYDTTTGPVTPEKIRLLSPPRKVNRYAATVGGPVQLPRLYDGRNRTFWMYGFQGFNRRNPNNSYHTVPTAAQKAGDFSSLLAINSTYQIYDPATITPAAGGRFSRQPFPGNRIPAARLDPSGRAYLQYFGEPNLPGTVDGRNNYQITHGNSNDFYQNMGRVDHVFNDRHRMFARVTQSWLNFYREDIFLNRVRGMDRHRKQRGVALDDVYVVSPSLLVNVKYGFTRFIESDFPFSRGWDLSTLGLPASLTSQLDSQAIAFPQTIIDGYADLGHAGGSQYITNYHTFAGSLNQTRGNHSFRYGGEYRVKRENTYSFGNVAPRLEFGNTWTRGPLDNSPAAPIGQGLASFMLGIPTGGGVDLNASRAEQSLFAGLYAQDDWKLTRKLTVNLGLRWEYEGAPTERFNRSVRGYDYATPNPISARARANYAAAPIPELPLASFRTIGGMTFTGLDSQPRGLFVTGKKNIAPRIGLAYQLTPKTVLRSGYGIFFDVVGVDRIHVNQAGFSQRTNLVASLDNGQTFIANLRNPFPDGLVKPGDVNLATFVGRGISFFPERYPTPYMQRWSFSIQRELPNRMLAEVGYIGNRGTRLATSTQQNPVPRQYLSTSLERDQRTIDFLSAAVTNPFFGLPEFAGSGMTGRTVGRSQLLREFPHFQGMSAASSDGYSWYHALIARAEKRFSHGYTFNVNYTWSKFMEATSFLNDTDPSTHRVISDQDRPHRLTLTGIYELPIGRGKAIAGGARGWVQSVIGGWQAQAIYQYQAGAPIGFGNIIFRGNLHDLVLPASQRTTERWFNVDAGFERSSARQLASNIRTFPLRLTGLRMDGDNYWDMSFSKEFRITERMKLQLRTDWEGAMNHASFSSPNNSPTSTLFGQVTSTRGEARRIYVGAKLSF